MRNKISISSEKAVLGGRVFHPLVKQCVNAALGAQGVGVPCEVNILFTDDAGIRRINLDQRGIDAPTDVLSFPMFSFTPGAFSAETIPVDPDTNLLPLGDIAISLERARAQAEEYGHSAEREVAYLTVHSVLHLLGYDHGSEEDRARMREREEDILLSLGQTREVEFDAG